MIQPWTVGAAVNALAQRPGDGRVREALCVDEPTCAVCSHRWTVSDCARCGLDIPPGRFVFAMRRRTVFDRPAAAGGS